MSAPEITEYQALYTATFDKPAPEVWVGSRGGFCVRFADGLRKYSTREFRLVIGFMRDMLEGE